MFSLHERAAEKAFFTLREIGIIEGCFSPFAAHYTTPGLFFSPFTYNPGLFFSKKEGKEMADDELVFQT